MSLDFIKDVIYGLKREYGQEGTFVKRSTSVNPSTGELSGDSATQFVPALIALPIDRRNAFLKSVGIHKAPDFEFNEQQFLVDKDDLGTFTVEIDSTKLTTGGYTQTVKYVEIYPHALIVTTTEPNL